MPLTRVNELSVDLGRHSSVESAESPWNPSPMPGPSSGGKMPKMAERRSSRRHSPYMKPAPASLGLSAPWDNLQLTARPRKGFAAVGVKKGAQTLEQQQERGRGLRAQTMIDVQRAERGGRINAQRR